MCALMLGELEVCSIPLAIRRQLGGLSPSPKSQWVWQVSVTRSSDYNIHLLRATLCLVSAFACCKTLSVFLVEARAVGCS